MHGGETSKDQSLQNTPEKAEIGQYKKQQNPAFPEGNEILLECTGVQMKAAGIEANSVTTNTIGSYGNSQTARSAQCSALGALSEMGRDLAAVVETWPTLTDSQRAAIMEIVNSDQNHPPVCKAEPG